MKSELGAVHWLLFSIIILSIPAILTQMPWNLFDFTSSGEIGDTIGGITSPFVGLLSAFLIYKAFIMQVKANDIQSKNNEIQSKNNEFLIAFKLIDDLESKLDEADHKYEYTLPSGEVNKVDKSNLYEIIRFWNGMRAYRHYYTNLIVVSIRQIKYFEKYVNSSTTLTAKDKALLFEKAGLTFGIKLARSFEALLQNAGSDLDAKDKSFYDFCSKFYSETLNHFLFHTIDVTDFD